MAAQCVYDFLASSILYLTCMGISYDLPKICATTIA